MSLGGEKRVAILYLSRGSRQVSASVPLSRILAYPLLQ